MGNGKLDARTSLTLVKSKEEIKEAVATSATALDI